MNKTSKIQKLIDNQLSKKERDKIIKEIKNNNELKIEYALLLQIKEQHRERVKEDLKQKLRNTPPSGRGTAALENIATAAFIGSQGETETPLPITDDTIEAFLNEEDEDDS